MTKKTLHTATGLFYCTCSPSTKMNAVPTCVHFSAALRKDNCCMTLQADSYAGVVMSFAGGSEAFSPAAEAA